MSKVYEQANAEAVAAQRNQAVADIARENKAGPKKTQAEWHKEIAADLAPEASDATGLADDLAAARERGLKEDAPWADRFVTHSPVPKTAEERQRLYTLSGLVWAIQRSLRALGEVTAKLLGHREEIGRMRAVQLGDQFRMDEARRHLRTAQRKIDAWSQAHPWRLRLSAGRPAQLVELDRDVELEERNIRDVKVAAKVASQEIARWRVEEAELVEQHDRAESKFREAVQAFCALGTGEVPALLAVLPQDARERVQALFPASAPEPKAHAVAEQTPLDPPALTPGRPRPRPMP